jgi:DNA adenine methylase
MQYFGGKQRIAKQISEFINTHTHTHYVEPFCGSCNVATLINTENKTLNDKHYYLIEMFKALQNGWVPPTDVSEDEYKRIQNNKEENLALSGFVGFACSFAGKFFGGYARYSKGGGTRNYAQHGINSLNKKMVGLKNAKFISKDFLGLDFENSLIYCDPPYRNTTQYYKKILGSFPYDDFLKWVKEQSRKNIVLVSEYKHNVPDGAKIVLEIKSKTDIRGSSGNAIDTVEVLWTYNDL